MTVSESRLQNMMAAIRHRGPDGSGMYLRGPVGLGHLRLSIIDTSELGHQPMATADGKLWITFNGEIYNFRELRTKLEQQGEVFRSNSDTEVLVRLYERNGAECLHNLSGMFAFAIWDENKQELFMARDRLGIKPLYYFQDSNQLVFASEIKAILQDESIPREINERALITYFTFVHGFAPDTIYRGIRKLLPGHYMRCSVKGTTIVKYWDLDGIEQQSTVDSPAHLEEVRYLLQRAVTSHMVSDVPIGAFLSGGIDSSAVVAYMATASARPIKTFSIGFDVGGQFNELKEARLIADKFQTEHHEKIVSSINVEELIHKLVYHYDEPFADAANLPTYILSEFAREKVTVVLSGEGGDEVFGGYRRYRAHITSELLRTIPEFLRFNLMKRLIPNHSNTRRLLKIVDTLQVVEEAKRYGSWVNIFNDDTRMQLFSPAIRDLLDEFDGYDVFRDYMHRQPQWDLPNRIMYTDLKGWMPDTYLEKIDKAAMAVSLEGRVPFLDHRLVEYAYSLPGKLKVRRSTTKYVLKKALEPVLPHSTLYRPKHGFTVPLDAWFRGRLSRFVADVLFDHTPRYCDYLDRGFVHKLYNEHTHGQRNWGTQLWAILNFELWHRTFLGAPHISASRAAFPTPQNVKSSEIHTAL
jgi:asparagine synthase (glutamine-hydrolysing)